MKKICIIGGFGGRDVGDEAMPRGAIISLRTLMPEVDIVMLSPNPRYTWEYHRERAVRHFGVGIPYAMLPLYVAGLFVRAALWRMGFRVPIVCANGKALYELATADLVFNVGGGNINSLVGPEFYRKMVIYLLARLLRIPVVVSGQTIGPFYGWLDAKLAAIGLNTVAMITLRDRGTSLCRLRKIGVSKPVVMETGDDALVTPAVSETESRQLLVRLAGKAWMARDARVTVAMNMKGTLACFNRKADVRGETELMTSLADMLVERCGARLLFIPTGYEGEYADTPVHRAIVEGMTHRHDAACVEEELDDGALKGLIGLMDVGVGVRYHFMVFALCRGVPALGMASGEYQRTKLRGLADLYDLPDLCLEHDMTRYTAQDITARMERIVGDREHLSRRLVERTAVLRERTRATARFAVQRLA